MAQRVEIFEVGPRDGLQNEARQIPTADKIALVDCLSLAGFARIECASFVSPKWVPQMADSGAVLEGINRAPGVSYAALTPNMTGLERAIAAKADEVAIFGSASEGFSKANINASIAESLERFRPVADAAKAVGLPVRGYVSCVVECPYDGVVAPGDVARVVAALRDMGCYEVSLGDTIGRGRPEAVDAMLAAVLQELPAAQLAGHFHDTGGRALENIEVSLARGLRVFDAAVGGLGGCPYAPGAAGNVATEAVHDRLVALGYDTGLDRAVLDKAAGMARAMRGQQEGRDG
ncbi:hydroxymethylglutaryl-CoA lyase [Tropicibacter oceani]|uniref:Hydroxymethylglutaryl-CoA lyase n=1 Tax=Tropicibacter oceani TaxID=3058420 RepID=A0ABY8QET6_9RHOB|nr:hydroxymethylglutaryl-CoA lyase [Tropicibacter oceani]WGW02551.1 hydroxymethylglutaryl-CoA lyase [Tropicibacter oceani]